MKKAVFTVAMLIIFCLPLTVFSQGLKVVYLDLQKVMVESAKGKEAKKNIEDEANRIKSNLEAKQSELQKLKDSLEKQVATMTPEKRTEKEKNYQSKVKDYQRLVNDSQADLRQKDMDLTQKILREIESIVKSIAEKEKYHIIFEKNQGGILYGDPSLDITNKVISAYNESSKKTSKR